MFSELEAAGIQDIHLKSDPDSQLRAIVAIHSTSLGPAIGGCRFLAYDSSAKAITDAIRLARGMSYKAALAGLPHGGGKAVLIRPTGNFNRPALFQQFGKFINELGGRYITAIDSGTQVSDMDAAARFSNYVSCTSDSGDPSPATAYGVFRGIHEAVKFKLGVADLKGIRVAIQGLGNVGYALAARLHQAGAKLLVTDLEPQKCHQARQQFNAQIIEPDKIYVTPCEVFSPCGLGAIINPQRLPQLDCEIIAGSANNQLATDAMGQQLHQRRILYCPDYLINAGGLVFVALKREGLSLEQILPRIDAIALRLGQLFNQLAASNTPINLLADRLAEQILYPPTLLQQRHPA